MCTCHQQVLIPLHALPLPKHALTPLIPLRVNDHDQVRCIRPLGKLANLHTKQAAVIARRRGNQAQC